ncbi:MAG: RimK/LysX family protein [Sulfurimonas sp.]|uniref:ATP-dependent zinc protease family protein n=1 Tax=Sulfurimonas sp. TaxID=2022749 RepID=UPI00261EE7A6|nr:RimK/LysX family protein [Sulfurimonas sp.]MDD2651765.1 RimK/LysX family protein [Sulfurimonas sp.]MDD3451683.1 RimK/LysX family protein [Sulfurimonas sp.]
MVKKRIIGRVEVISIPILELYNLDAKIDTGADSNALHCDAIFVENDIVHFTLVDEVHPTYNYKKMTLPLYKMKRIKSSNGKTENRPSVRVKVNFFGKSYTTVISLTNRSDMKYPMLIGRKFLAKKFLVDVSREYLTQQTKEEKK